VPSTLPRQPFHYSDIWPFCVSSVPFTAHPVCSVSVPSVQQSSKQSFTVPFSLPCYGCSWRGQACGGFRAGFSSPFWCTSPTISAPPKNSPPTYICGTVGQSEKVLTTFRQASPQGSVLGSNVNARSGPLWWRVGALTQAIYRGTCKYLCEGKSQQASARLGKVHMHRRAVHSQHIPIGKKASTDWERKHCRNSSTRKDGKVVFAGMHGPRSV
jgi:hypothetical protein